MSDQTNTQKAVSEANARLQEMESELSGLSGLIKQADKNARAATTEPQVLKYLGEKERLEKRQKTLPYLIRHAKIAVLKARADVASETREVAWTEIPAAIAERDAAKDAFEQADQRLKEAEKALQQLQRRADGADSNRRMLLTDAENIEAGRPTVRYFTQTA